MGGGLTPGTIPQAAIDTAAGLILVILAAVLILSGVKAFWSWLVWRGNTSSARQEDDDDTEE